jgi:Flp pilus assembly protein CpaB
VFAATDIPLGTVVRAEMLRMENRPVTSRDVTAFQDSSLVIGQTVRTNVVEGKQLTAKDFAITGAPVTVDCPTQQRCIGVRVDQVTGVGTLIRAGDYVDLLVGINMNVITVDPDTGAIVPGAPEIRQASTKLILQGMQVVGTLLPPVPPPAEGGPPAGDPGTTLNDQQEIVILSVDAQQSEVIKWAQMQDDLRTISLVLRSPGDFRDPSTQDPIIPPPAETTGITLSQLVDEYGVLVPEILEATLGEQEQP